jgi:hypothetical protein
MFSRISDLNLPAASSSSLFKPLLPLDDVFVSFLGITLDIRSKWLLVSVLLLPHTFDISPFADLDTIG